MVQNLLGLLCNSRKGKVIVIESRSMVVRGRVWEQGIKCKGHKEAYLGNQMELLDGQSGSIKALQSGKGWEDGMTICRPLPREQFFHPGD